MTDQFLDSCFLLVLNEKHDVKLTKTLYRDVNNILNFYILKENGDIPILFKNKIECLQKICELKTNNLDSKTIVDSITSSDKYTSLSEYLNEKINIEIDSTFINETNEYIKLRKKFCDLFNNYDKLSDIIESAKIGTFTSMHDVMRDYESTIKDLYNKLMEYNRSVNNEPSVCMDLSLDNYDALLESINTKFVDGNTLGTGYPEFDKNAFNAGGFESSRVYIFGGESGGGKSTIMLNCMKNAFMKNTFRGKSSVDKKSVIVYITLENLIDETFVRLYQSTFGMGFKDFVNETKYKTPSEIKEKISSALFTESNSTLVCRYFPKYSITVNDINTVLDDVISMYGNDCIVGVFVDYLDLLKSSEKEDAYRLELSKITSALKDTAVAYDVPVITATQLSRDVYNITDVAQLTLASMSESIKKVEHADFIALMVSDKTRPNSVYMKIAKNRCGKNKLTFQCDVEFDKFLFNSINLYNNSINDGLTEYDSLPKDIQEKEPKKRLKGY